MSEPISVAVLLLNGGMASTAIMPLEIFNCAGRLWNLLSAQACSAPFKVTTASIDGNPVRTDRHLTLSPETSFNELTHPDLVFVPAGGLELDALFQHGYDIDDVIAGNAGVTDWLLKWAKEGCTIAAVCSGVALPAHAGLLDGKIATSHWGLADLYRERFPKVDWQQQFLVTDAGKILCGGGANAAADLSLYIVEKFCGRQMAQETARALMIEMPRTWQNSFTHFSLRANHDDELILKSQRWLQQHYAEDVQLDEVAQDSGMSPRNFMRRFKAATGDTPLGYLQGIRIAVAKQLLERSHTTVQGIAQQVGYTDLIFFRNLFKRHTGLCPNEYRTRFA
jgi:transcriptional regulator GlxA family with amidase domain